MKLQEEENNEGPRHALCFLGRGLVDDLSRRARVYLSDYTDGLIGDRSLYKTVSTTVFLYFSIILPCIAFGVLDSNNTDGQLGPMKTIIGQALGGLFFALAGGQPLVVVMTTAPICIYIKVIYQISQDLEVGFLSFYACVGLLTCVFLVLMSLTNLSDLMRYCTRSTENIFALFTALAFGSDGIKETFRSFRKYYWDPDCSVHSASLTHHHHAHSHIKRQAAELISGLGNATLSDSINATGHSASTSSPLVMLASQTAATLPRLIATNATSSYNGTNSTFAAAAATTTTTTTASSVVTRVSTSLADHLYNFTNNSAHQQYSSMDATPRCHRETCILFIFLMSGTIWLANSFNSFHETHYLSSKKREIIKDYSLAISVIIFSFVGSYLFSDVHLDVFEFSEFAGFHTVQMAQFTPHALIIATILAFMLSILFYIDHNICGNMANNAPYKLKKGNYFHMDLLVLAILNAFLSLYGLPWMQGKLPHSHLHAKALADYEERAEDGCVSQAIVNIRETRLTGAFCSLLIGLSILAVPYPLSYIPLPVLSGVFLYTALSEFKSNLLVERICLFFTEKSAYPDTHYIKHCPTRDIHLFTTIQIFQLAIVALVGFYPNPYVNFTFPLVIAIFVPFRILLLPILIDDEYLKALDTHSLEG